MQAASTSKEAKEVSNIEMEALKATYEWTKAFEDMDNVSTTTLKNLIALLTSYIDKWKDSGDAPESLKAAVQAEQNNSSADRTAVDNAVRNTGNAFKSAVEDARVQATLSVIVDKVNSGSMSKDKALKEVYELYKKNPNNDRICQNLVTLCDMCIMEYVIADKWGASSVKSILDSLNNNKSAAFNRHKGK